MEQIAGNNPFKGPGKDVYGPPDYSNLITTIDTQGTPLAADGTYYTAAQDCYVNVIVYPVENNNLYIRIGYPGGGVYQIQIGTTNSELKAVSKMLFLRRGCSIINPSDGRNGRFVFVVYGVEDTSAVLVQGSDLVSSTQYNKIYIDPLSKEMSVSGRRAGTFATQNTTVAPGTNHKWVYDEYKKVLTVFLEKGTVDVQEPGSPNSFKLMGWGETVIEHAQIRLRITGRFITHDQTFGIEYQSASDWQAGLQIAKNWNATFSALLVSKAEGIRFTILDSILWNMHITIENVLVPPNNLRLVKV
jgi:hypothetical protein